MTNTDNTLRVRPATEADLPAMMRMYDHSRSIMRANGNATQWTAGYPKEELISDDIRRHVSYVVEEVADPCGPPLLAGCFAFIIGRDPTYTLIEEGSWEDDDVPYGTIHRLACAPSRHGIAASCLDYCDSLAPSLRIDTHADNAIMQHIAARNGFSYRGIIHIADGTPRLAYQRLLPSHLLRALTDYAEHVILPLYDHFDEAHQQPHIRSVMRRSMEMATHYEVNINIVYAAAACHDLGICEGRERHHLVSGSIIRQDAQLAQWFSPTQIETIAQAAEDHRASNRNSPRSLYGLILSEADRDIDSLTVVRRTLQYSLAHYPTFSQEQHWQRTLQHLREKYGTGGYLQIRLALSPNVQPLSALRALIADEPRLHALFLSLYAEEMAKR